MKHLNGIVLPDGTAIDSADDLGSGGGGGGGAIGPLSGWVLELSGNQAVADNTPHTVTWGSVVKDTDGYLTSGTTVTIPAGKAGLYVLDASAGFTPDTGAYVRVVNITVNGTQVYGTSVGDIEWGEYWSEVFQKVVLLELEEGDTLVVNVHHDAGTGVSIGMSTGVSAGNHSTYFRGFLIYPPSPPNVPPINTQPGDYTLALTDAGGYVHMDSATEQTLTVPDNATVAFPVGSIVGVYQSGAGALTVAAATGVVVHGVGSLSAQYAEASLRKVAADEWTLVGQVTAA